MRANFLKSFKIKHLAISSKSPGLKFCRFVSLLPDFLLWSVGPVTLHPHVCDTRVTYCALLRVARPRYPRPIAAAEHIADALAGGDQPVQVDTGSNAQPLQQVHHIFRGDVAGSAFGIRAATQPCHRAVEHIDTFEELA